MKRFMQATWKNGRSTDLPNLAKQTYNAQADLDDTADAALMHDSYTRWLYEGVGLVREYLTAEPTVSNDETTMILLMPGNWEHYSPNAPGLKYAIRELILNGMLGDWYDEVKPELAKTFKQKAELNKAEIYSIIYSLKPPTVTVTSAAGTFAGGQ